MRIAILNKSDAHGGAAVVSRRLMHALRSEGVDAKMLVVEKLTDDEHVIQAVSTWRSKIPFLTERAEIFASNGFNRSDLFKADTATFGLPLYNHPLVKDADAVILNWVNQGMLSLEGIAHIAAMKKPLLWVMHDMWCATGICHHAGQCRGYMQKCGSCTLLGKASGSHDLSHRVHNNKHQLYAQTNIRFIAVSNWLAERCRESSLMESERISVIPNAFHLPKEVQSDKPQGDIMEAVMAAARLDDDVKGFPILLRAIQLLPDDTQRRLRIVLCGDLRDKELLRQMSVLHDWKGVVNGSEMPDIYKRARLVLSPSLYETLPGTLVEGQAYGCLPVAFDRGGQRDIITDGDTGILAQFGNDTDTAAQNFSEAIVRAINLTDSTSTEQLTGRMRESVERRFAAENVAGRYLELIEKELREYAVN